MNNEETEIPFSDDENIQRSVWFLGPKSKVVLYGVGVVEDGTSWCFCSEVSLVQFGFEKIGEY